MAVSTENLLALAKADPLLAGIVLGAVFFTLALAVCLTGSVSYTHLTLPTIYSV